MTTLELTVHLRILHANQELIKASTAKRKIVRAGRRSGKTVFAADWAVDNFLDGKRVLYGVPTADQLQKFWFEVTRALAEPIEAGIFKMDKTMHTIERPGTENRIRAKTCWSADTLRGDYADRLILDEVQLMDEQTWGLVGAPLLLDNNGDAVFIYTPPSLHSRSTSKARDKGWMTKFAKLHANDPKGRWEIFSFTSHDNPYISAEALGDITEDMSATAIRQEIYAEDMDEAPGALWTRANIDATRTLKPPEIHVYEYIVVAVDPSATSGGDEAGIITAGTLQDNDYVLSDDSVQGSPKAWASAAIAAYRKFSANKIVAEANNGGEMVQNVIAQIDPDVSVELVWASRGKATRAEPVSARYEKNKVHHVGTLVLLEDEMVLWTPGDPSPNRMDALVWAITALKENKSGGGFAMGYRGNPNNKR